MTIADASPALPSLALDADTQRLLFLDARSNILFADREVDSQVIHDAFDLIKWGPTGNNNVPARIVIARSEQARRVIIDTANPGNRPKLEQAPLLVVVARDERFHDHLAITIPGGDEEYAARLEADPVTRLQRAERGTWLQAGYLIIGLRAAGLAVRPYAGFDLEAVDRELLAGTPWRAQLLLAVGYPAEEHGAGPRKGRVPASQAVLEL